MAENSLLTKTEITIQDYNNNNPVIFSNLTLSEAFISVNNFSFTVRPADNNGTLGSIIDFKKQVMGKEVQLNFKDGDGNANYKFKGVINEVNSALIDNNFYQFQINGSGIFSKVNEFPEYKSFYNKKLDAIIDGAFQNSNLKSSINKTPVNTKELHYTVLYNQTLFGFMSQLAVRFGEWMFYDGEKLQFGKKPATTAIELKSPSDVSNLNIRAQAVKAPKGLVSTDIFKSAMIQATTKETVPDNPLLKAAEDSGKHSIEDAAGNVFVPSGFNQEVVNDKFKLEQQAIFASSVFITGNTRNNKLAIGKIIKIKDADDTSGKSFIITQIQHNVFEDSHYSNSFTAIPLEASVPPYTNPLLTPKATAQAAVITDNEDDAGLARVKVKFPWMADGEKTPWISVLTPHSGKDKGFRFLPEVDDEVMIDFWDGNAELPFVSGSLYTEKNKPGIAEAGNHIKMVGSRSGRSMVIDDDKGILSISDGGNKPGKGKNLLELKDKDGDQSIKIVSGEDGSNHYAAIMDYKGKKIDIYCQSGGTPLVNIIFDADSKKISIISKGDIDINADGNINMEAKKDIKIKGMNVNISADMALKMEGTSEVQAKGTNIKVTADAQLEMKSSAMANVEGSVLNLKGSGMAVLKGGVVMIN